MRPPIDLPPASSGRSGACVCGRGDRGAHRREQGRARVRAPAAGLHVGKLVAERRDPDRGERARSIAAMNRWRMPAPAPWARTRSERAPCRPQQQRRDLALAGAAANLKSIGWVPAGIVTSAPPNRDCRSHPRSRVPSRACGCPIGSAPPCAGDLANGGDRCRFSSVPRVASSRCPARASWRFCCMPTIRRPRASSGSPRWSATSTRTATCSRQRCRSASCRSAIPSRSRATSSPASIGSGASGRRSRALPAIGASS